MQRRSLLKSSALAAGALLGGEEPARGALPKMKITRIRYYYDPRGRPIFNQSSNVITVETDQGITGIGEGGSKDTVEQLGAMIIGEDPTRIEHLWQIMYRGYFYPPGREKVHALGGLDMALWDIKGKALGVPVYELLGGLTRDHIECYSTGYPSQGSLKETARACMEAGFRAFRTSVAGPAVDSNEGFISQRMVDETYRRCQEIREGVGTDGDWAIDYHTRLDVADAVRLSSLIEDLTPYFVEDLIRSENVAVYETIREKVNVPIAVGEHFGDRWDVNELIENNWMDYSRVSIPNSGGITEFMKIAALCETHYVGLIPHFTGPIGEAALVHCCGAFSGPAMMEMTGDGKSELPHLPQCYDFRDGKMWPNDRPGLGVEFDAERLDLVSEITEYARPIPMYFRPDGSVTNW